MRERHVGAPRESTWAVLMASLGENPADLSVEPPWRHVRRHAVDGVERCETTVCLRDDGAECHLAWCAGTTAEGERADRLLADLAREAEALLEEVATVSENGER
jgi:hypothetical protein